MSGIEPLLAAAAAAAAEAATAVGGATAAGAAGSAAATGTAAAATTAATTAAATGLTAAEIAGGVGAASSLAGTGAALLNGAPKINTPHVPTVDEATRESQQRQDLLKGKRGRASTLLTDAGGAGLSTTPSLGAAALLGQ